MEIEQIVELFDNDSDFRNEVVDIALESLGVALEVPKTYDYSLRKMVEAITIEEMLNLKLIFEETLDNIIDRGNY